MSESCLADEVLLPGRAKAHLLRLDRPLSFWGGVDPRTGAITDPRHPQYGENVSGRILAMERTIGSSSGSSVILELMAIGKAPAGLVMMEADAILTLGIVVARELGYGSIPVFLVDHVTFEWLNGIVSMSDAGDVTNNCWSL